MVNRQLVLVAIDHATDMTRAIRVALSVAKARGAESTSSRSCPPGRCGSTTVRMSGLPSLTTTVASVLEGPAEEYKHLMHHVEDVRVGRFVVMVLAQGRDRRTIAADILDEHDAEFVGFYGRWAWQGRPASSATAVADRDTDANA